MPLNGVNLPLSKANGGMIGGMFNHVVQKM